MPKITAERARSLRAQNDERFEESAQTIYEGLMRAMNPAADLMTGQDKAELSEVALRLFRLRTRT